MSSHEITERLRDLKPYLSENFNVNRIGIFGSFARGEEKETSDIDIVVEFKKSLGWAFFDLQDFLENELKRKVDLVSVKALKEQLREKFSVR
jgi:predicted nucleotidyltransferase